MVVDRVGRHARSWSYIQGSTRDHENDRKTNNFGWMLNSVYAILGVCCTRCMLYSVSTHDHNMEEKERDDLTVYSAMIVELWTRKRELGDEDENDVEDMNGYEKSGVRPAWLGCEDLVWVIFDAGSGLIPAVLGMVNLPIHEILWSLSFSWWFTPSPLLSLFLVLNSTITYEHQVKSSLSISPCHDQELTPSTAYTEYSIYQVQHTLCTAYTESSIQHVQHILSTAYTTYCIIPRSTVSHSQPVSHLWADHVCTQFSTFPQLQDNKWIEFQLPLCLPSELLPPDWLPPDWPPPDWPPPDWSPPDWPPSDWPPPDWPPPDWPPPDWPPPDWPPPDWPPPDWLPPDWPPPDWLPPDWLPPDWPPPSTPPISLNYGLQVHLQTCLIIASKCIS